MNEFKFEYISITNAFEIELFPNTKGSQRDLQVKWAYFWVSVFRIAA